MKFSERLKQTRIKQGFTQDEFAKKLNISASSISLYENGDREPSLATLKTISETLNVSTDYLLGLTDVENIESSKVSLEYINDLIQAYIKDFKDKLNND